MAASPAPYLVHTGPVRVSPALPDVAPLTLAPLPLSTPAADYAGMSTRALVAACARRHLDADGGKAAIVERLVAADWVRGVRAALAARKKSPPPPFLPTPPPSAPCLTACLPYLPARLPPWVGHGPPG